MQPDKSHTTGHTGRVPWRFDRVKPVVEHRVGGDQWNRSSGCPELGGVMMIPVALVFLAFAHRINDAGSTHAYVWGGAGCSIRLPHRTDGAPLLSHLCRRW